MYTYIDTSDFGSYTNFTLLAMRFEWDEDKNWRNLHKHDVRFETAALVFDDPYAITQRDRNFDGEE